MGFYTDSVRIPYQLYKPLQDSKAKYPIVVCLHGAGERGNDNVAQMANGYLELTQLKFQEKHKCFVLTPQCEEGEKWVDTEWTAASQTFNQIEDPYIHAVNSLLDSILKQNNNIDKARIYIIGISMGGFAVWDVVARYPSRFAAAVPICGGGDTSMAKYLKETPIWAFHGANDKLVLHYRSRNMVKAITNVGGKIKYTEYPDVGHNAWTYAMADIEMYNWMFGQKKVAK